MDLTSSPYISNSAHDVSSRPVDISISYVRSQSGPVGDLSTAADVDFQYSQDYDDDNGVGYTQDNGYGHGSGPDLDISDFVQESRREHDKIDAISSSGAIAAVSEVHLLSIFQADEQELIANDINIFSPILVQAIVLGIRKRAVTCDAYTVWAEVDDGASKEVVAISSKFVETFLKMSPAEYVDLVSSRKLSKQERKEQESKIWIKFYQLCGIFWAKRRKPIHTTMDGNFINLESQENEEEPVIELIELVPDSISSTAESMDVTT